MKTKILAVFQIYISVPLIEIFSSTNCALQLGDIIDWKYCQIKNKENMMVYMRLTWVFYENYPKRNFLEKSFYSNF